ncbi:hypothetical protein BGW38_002493 [Lunasporangiospora selenospora]|uniref:Aldose 1-epimerase n=1 Tax=Lunasporangiospora selenospora TaxID=979761 RepID=A0A9P6KHU5_9FUNG|nr:hypothetical protein BGW38_002493 [Lunasporangiospora selenospora]
MPVVERTPVPSVEGQGLPVGTPIRSFILTDDSSPGMACQVINLGATLSHLWVRDNSQKGIRDVVLGFDDLTAYRSKHDPYFGASVGRTANRIANGQFTLPDNPTFVYQLDKNNGPNSLHGGVDGFSFRIWDVELPSAKQSSKGTSLQFRLLSDHLDQGFPGRLCVYCTYRLHDYALEISYHAYIDGLVGDRLGETTIVSLTNHAYFNLNGVPNVGRNPSPHSKTPAPISTVENHILNTYGIESYLETDSTSVPTGRVLSLDQVPAMDFRKAKAVGQDLAQTPGGGHGYDHFYLLQVATALPSKYLQKDGHQETSSRLVASVYSPESGIEMKVSTTDPGFQLYTANSVKLDPNVIDCDTLSEEVNPGFGPTIRYIGKARGGYSPHSALCLEASRFPDAINHPSWRDQVLLRLGEEYRSTVTFAFSTKESNSV